MRRVRRLRDQTKKLDLTFQEQQTLVLQGKDGLSALAKDINALLSSCFELKKNLDRVCQEREVEVESRTEAFQKANIKLRDEVKRSNLLYNRLRESEERYRNLINNMQETVIVVQDGLIKFHNSRLPGVSYPYVVQINEKPFIKLFHPDYREKISSLYETLMKGEQETFLLRGKLAENGSETPVWFEARASRIVWYDRYAMLICLVDITREKEVEQYRMLIHEQRADSRKMDAIARIVYGVAHEFNNIITPIVNMSHFCMDKLEDSNLLWEPLEMIYQSGLRASAITKRLLTFTGDTPMSRTASVKLADAVDDMENVLKSSLPENFNLYFEHEDIETYVDVDRNQLDQIILCLFVNSRSSMKDSGTIVISTGEERVDDKYVETHPEAAAGHYAWLSVADNGPGVPQDSIKDIFDPFFDEQHISVKDGLELSVIYGIVKAHGGWITVLKEDPFTEFRCYFPVKQSHKFKHKGIYEENLPKPVDQPEREAKNSIKGSGETVLVVDDSKIFRNAVLMTLFTSGYNTMAASSGDEALSIIKEKGDDIQLLLTDIVMPDMSGYRLVRELWKIYPDMPVILISGYYNETDLEKFSSEFTCNVKFLKKPCMPEQILQNVSYMLAKNRAEAIS